MNEVSPRELQVLRLVAEGLGDRQIAARLKVSPSTVKKHTFKLRIKLRQSSRLGIVMEALRRGLIQVPA